jgi:hypothetical protein
MRNILHVEGVIDKGLNITPGQDTDFPKVTRWFASGHCLDETHDGVTFGQERCDIIRVEVQIG